jgi:hypothetical protein
MTLRVCGCSMDKREFEHPIRSRHIALRRVFSAAGQDNWITFCARFSLALPSRRLGKH